MSQRFAERIALTTATVVVMAILSGCCTLVPPTPEVKVVTPAAQLGSTDKVTTPEERLAVFSAQLVSNTSTATGSTAKSSSGTTGNVGTGKLVAVYDPDTGLFRWQLSYSGLKRIPKSGQFHGRDGPDTGGTSYLTFSAPVKSPMEGRANLTETQAADLLAGRWYVSIRTSAFPNGEIRGQLVLHE